MTDRFTARSFSPTDLSAASRAAIDAATAVAATLREHFGATEFSTKQDEQDWVTRWDVWAESVIRERLSAAGWGGVGFRGEEGGAQPGADVPADVYWTIDPIDGTTHFVRGNEFCTTMLALVDHGVPVVGVINDFVRGNLYTAIAGRGAYRNLTDRMSVSGRPICAAQIELYTDEETVEGHRLRLMLERSGASLIRHAASGFTFLSVMRGATEGFVTLGDPHCSEWDIAPGCLLVQEAGGIVRNIGRDTFDCRIMDYIAANSAVYSAVTEVLNGSADRPNR